jgi:hypothetical protein
VLQREQSLFALARGDVLANAAVADEVPRLVVHRLAAHRDPVGSPVLIDAAELQVAKRAARLQVGAMRRPAGLGHVEVMPFPALLADHLCAPGIDARADAGDGGEAKFGVLFPVQVRGKPGEAAEARFAFAQRHLGGDPRGDVFRDTSVPGEGPARVENRPAVHADVGQLAIRRAATQQQVVERLARFQQAAMLVPGLADDFGARQLPSAKADVRLRRDPGAGVALPAGADETQLRILLPVPVRGQLGKRAEARLALAQRVEGARLHGRQPDQPRQRRFGEVRLLQEVVGAAREHRVAQERVQVGGDRDDRTARHADQGRDGGGTGRVRQVQVGDDQVDLRAREQRERLGQRRGAVELALREGYAPQVGGDDLDAERVVLEQQDAHRLARRGDRFGKVRTRQHSRAIISGIA